MNIEFKEIYLDWPSEISVFELKNYILSKLLNYGDPLRWAITSLTTHTEKSMQQISVEAVLIVDAEKKQENRNYLN